MLRQTRLTLLVCAITTVSNGPVAGQLTRGLQVESVFRQTGFEDQGADVIKDGATTEGGRPPVLALPLPQAAEGSGTLAPVDSSPSFNAPENDEDSASQDIRSHWYMHHRGGGQFGQPTPYSTLGYFQPVNLENGILFGQTHIILSNDGAVGGSVSAGRRWYLPEQNRIVGTALSFDATPTPYQGGGRQLALSFDTRGERWDVFANGYLPTGQRTRLSGSPVPGNIRYAGNNLVVDLMDQAETAMSGVDIQVSRRLGNQNLWAFGGWYQFQGNGERIDGGMFGLRSFLFDSLAMSLNVSEDPVFGSNVGFTATYFFGGDSDGDVAPQSVRSRMAEPIVRRETVTRRERTVLAATQTLTSGGNPITIAHTNDAGPGGSGSFSNPFGTLNGAAGSPADIVLVHANTVFNGQQFAIGPNQQFLGESAVPHLVATDQLGPVPLPDATGGLNAPVIMTAPGNAIVLGPNSVASDFIVQSAGGAGVFGQDVGSVRVENIVVQGAAGPGLQLEVTGANVLNASVLNNTFTGNGAQSGFLFGPNAGAVLNANVVGNDDSLGFLLNRDANGFLRLGGGIGQGGFFNDDNGNLAGNNNTSAGGPPVVNILGVGNQIEIIDPGMIPAL